MNAKLLEERTIFKVVPPARVEADSLRPGFSHDAGCWFRLGSPTSTRAVSRRASVCRCLLQTPSCLPMDASNAGSIHRARLPECRRLAQRQRLCHKTHSTFLNVSIRHNVTMVVGPTPNDGIEMTNQVGLTGSAMLTDALPHLFQKVMRVLLGGSDEQLAVELAEVLSEEVESVVRYA